MSTNSSIGIKRIDGSETRIYCHWDGYIEYNGVILQLAYNTAEKVEALLALGDLSSLGYYLARPQEPVEGMTDSYCNAYHRDGGEEFRQSSGRQEFNYTFDEAQAIWLVEEEVYTKGTKGMKTLSLDSLWFYKSSLLLDVILAHASKLDGPDGWSSDEFAESGGVTQACVKKALEARQEIIDREREEHDAWYRAYCD